VPLHDVPDPVFSQGMVGYGAAIDPPRGVVDAVAPVAGTLLKLLPHAYVVMTASNVGILVHLGLDTVQLNGAGFTAHVKEGDTVAAGQVIITYDVGSVEAAGLNPIVPVVVMDERELVILPEARAIGSVAAAISALLDRKPTAVLGLATGSSPLAIYDELASRCDAGLISFRQARGFMLDEYVGLDADHPQRYQAVTDTVFVSRVDFAPAVQGWELFADTGVNTDTHVDTSVCE
jgi:PTS system glucose-specific IIA component